MNNVSFEFNLPHIPDPQNQEIEKYTNNIYSKIIETFEKYQKKSFHSNIGPYPSPFKYYDFRLNNEYITKYKPSKHSGSKTLFIIQNCIQIIYFCVTTCVILSRVKYYFCSFLLHPSNYC